MRHPRMLELRAAAAAMALGLGMTLAGGAPAAAAAARPEPTAEDWARLERLEDFQAIHKLLARYQTAVDSNNWPVYGSLFARNGEIVFQQNHWVGPKQITEGMQAAENAPNSVLKSLGLKHPTMNQKIDIQGDKARVVTRWTVISRRPDGGPLLGATGRVEDEIVREDGQWKFLKRMLYAEIPFQDLLADQAAAAARR